MSCDDLQSSDFKWFVENLESLYSIYGDSHIAIKDKKVIGKFSSYVEGVEEMSKTNELGSFIVQKCGEDESVYTTYIASTSFC